MAEKGGSVLEKITAHPNFFILATMNPGGDYGKKELSPALRNRFTEIWVPAVTDIDELQSIAVDRYFILLFVLAYWIIPSPLVWWSMKHCYGCFRKMRGPILLKEQNWYLYLPKDYYNR